MVSETRAGQPSRPHDWGPDGTADVCQACEEHFLDVDLSCPGPAGGDAGWTPTHRGTPAAEAAYAWECLNWLAAFAMAAAVTFMGVVLGRYWLAMAGGCLLGVTVAAGRRSLRRAREHR